jgi:hypothetical protein
MTDQMSSKVFENILNITASTLAQPINIFSVNPSS